jgi:hypothetical protein
LIGTALVLRRNAKTRTATTNSQDAAPLSPEEQKRLDKLLGKKT